MKTYMKPISATVRLIVATAVVFVATLSIAYASVSKKVALVIGNGQYQTATPLTNPANDALDMTLKLQTLGFDVVSGQDLDLRGLRKTVREFIGKTQGADVALFFYAGHGLQVAGKNYLLPVDANLKKEDDLDFETLPVNMVLNAMERNSKATLLFLDACRNNPLSRGLSASMGTRSASVGRGLAEIGSGVGTLISFATKPGAVALDGKGRNSPFTTALLKHIGTPGQDIARTLIDVRRDVLVATNQAQVPWENSSLTRRVILNDAVVEPVVTLPNPAKNAVTAVQPKAGNNALLQVEIAFWSSVERAATAEGYTTYLAKYPNGSFSKLAQIELRKLHAAKMKPQMVPAAENDTKTVEVASLGKTELAYVEPVQPNGIPIEKRAVLSQYDRIFGIQKELTRLGCRPGSVDGVAGRNTSLALSRYSRVAGVDLRNGGYSHTVLKILREEKTIFCKITSKDRVTSVSTGRKKKAIKSRSVNPARSKKRIKSSKSVSRKKTIRRKAKVQPKRKSRSKRRNRRVVVRHEPRVERRRPRRTDRQRRQRNRAAIGLAVGIAGAILLNRR